MSALVQSLSTVFDLLLVILGFGLIIFIHELGHFLAARWAGIRVLAFAVGFGSALFSFRKGLGLRRGSTEPEYFARLAALGATINSPPAVLPGISPTEYRLNFLPFGGYVKMLGQVDADPSQVSPAPDGYQSCPPWKRMVVISAGVIANVITAAILFIIVYSVGLTAPAPTIGVVLPNSPADRAEVTTHAGAIPPETTGGLLPGDVVLSIDGKPVRRFEDIASSVAMAGRDTSLLFVIQRGPIRLHALVRPVVNPATGLLEIGAGVALSLQVHDAERPAQRKALEDALADQNLTGVRPGMTLASVDGLPVASHAQLQNIVRASQGRPLDLVFTSPESNVSVTVTPTSELETALVQRGKDEFYPMEHLLGLTPVLRIRNASPPDNPIHASKQGFEDGDVFARIGNVEFPNVEQGVRELRAHSGKAVDVVVLRTNAQGTWDEVSLPGVNVSSSGAVGFLIDDTAATSTLLSAPPARIARSTLELEGYVPPAYSLGLSPGAQIIAVNDRPVSNFSELRDALLAGVSSGPSGHDITLHIRRPISGIPDPASPLEPIRWSLSPADAAALQSLGWKIPEPFQVSEITLRANNPIEALSIGLDETQRVMASTYLTFRRLIFDRTIRVEHLKGPIGIAHLGTLIAGKGLIWLLFFLALISINLAVINFLPLPIVDGGQFLFLLYEQLRGRPAPIAIQNALTVVGLMLILSLFLVVTFHDVKNLLGL